jgi:hypothetical protein
MEAIRFKPQSESRFVSNPIAPGVGQINSGILTLSGSIHSRNLTITSIHKVGQTIPGIPGSDDSRNKWVRLFPEYMGELIPGIGGSEVSGIFNCTSAGVICPVLVRGCGTLGKGFGLCGWMCGLWQVCCLGRPHCRVRYAQIWSNSMIGRKN